MELLKQLESKLHALVQQRNELREELERTKAEHQTADQELQDVRSQLAELQAEKAALLEERTEVRVQVEGILTALEELA
jgi:chromosome segregation ATPase